MLFSLWTMKDFSQQRKVLLEEFWKCNLYLKKNHLNWLKSNKLKLPGWRFFLSPVFPETFFFLFSFALYKIVSSKRTLISVEGLSYLSKKIRFSKCISNYQFFYHKLQKSAIKRVLMLLRSTSIWKNLKMLRKT